MEHKVFHEAACMQENCFKNSTFHCRIMALCFTLTAGTCFKKCGHNLNQTNDDEDKAELSIPRETAIRCKQVYCCKHMHPVILM